MVVSYKKTARDSQVMPEIDSPRIKLCIKPSLKTPGLIL